MGFLIIRVLLFWIDIGASILLKLQSHALSCPASSQYLGELLHVSWLKHTVLDVCTKLYGCFYTLGILFVGVLIIRAPSFG